MTAATILTVDSSASDNRPTEPVSLKATSFSENTATPVAMESQAYLVRSRGVSVGLLVLTVMVAFWQTRSDPPGSSAKRRTSASTR